MKSKRPSLKEIRLMICNAIAVQDDRMTSGAGSENPQVKEMVMRAEAKSDALNAVYDALKGNAVLLKIMGEGVPR
jgi:hypothetical protein